MRAFALVVGFLLVCAAAHSETDVLLRTVGFALTGSDDADPKVIGDRANCIFAIKNDAYHLNNVQTDHITILRWQRRVLGHLKQWVTVRLQGDDVVFEETSQSKDDDRDSYKEYELRLMTDDSDRVKKAWQYIYSHGCTGKQSPS